MLTFDKHTGSGLTGWDACAARIEQLLTTALGERIKRRDYGVRLLNHLSVAISDREILLMQNDLLRGLSDPVNGIAPEFKVEQVAVTVVAGRLETVIKGDYRGAPVTFPAALRSGN